MCDISMPLHINKNNNTYKRAAERQGLTFCTRHLQGILQNESHEVITLVRIDLQQSAEAQNHQLVRHGAHRLRRRSQHALQQLAPRKHAPELFGWFQKPIARNGMQSLERSLVLSRNIKRHRAPRRGALPRWRWRRCARARGSSSSASAKSGGTRGCWRFSLRRLGHLRLAAAACGRLPGGVFAGADCEPIKDRITLHAGTHFIVHRNKNQ